MIFFWSCAVGLRDHISLRRLINLFSCLYLFPFICPRIFFERRGCHWCFLPTLKREREMETWASRAAAGKRNKRSVVGVTWLLWWMGSPAALPLLTLGLKSALKPSAHTFESLELDFFCVFRPALCVLCCVSPPQNADWALFQDMVPCRGRDSSLLLFNLPTLWRSKWQLGCKEERLSSAGDFFFFPLRPPRVPRINLHAAVSLSRLFVRK